MPENNKPQPQAPTTNKNNTVWWIVGACIVIPIILLIIGAIVIFAGGYFISKQISNIDPMNQENNYLNEFEQEFGNSFDDEFKKELEKLEKELNDLDQEWDEDINQDKKDITPKQGIIEGSLSYPSEAIPDLTVCATETSGNTTDICTSNLINDSKYTAERGYQLVVPPGTYHVYSYLGDPSYTGIYSEYVTCGLHVDCPSHDFIDVVVMDGDHYQNIDPIDWYVP